MRKSLNLQVITGANSFQAMGLLPKCNFLFSHGDERPPPDVEINKHVSKPESFLGMIESSAEGTPLAGSPGSNTAVRTRRRALRAQPDQQWFGLGPRKWASKLAVNDPGWNPGEISRKSPALQGLSFTKNSAYNISVGTPLQFYVYAGQSVLTGMITQHFHDAQSWAAENFGSAQLGHKRRTKRLVVTAHQIADQPEGSLPSKFPWNPLRAVYRLCNRPEVTHHGVTAPHFRLTRQRMDQPDPLLILHDTTELDFTSHQALRGTGPIGDGGGRGFLQHNSLAIHAETGEILGLAFQQIRTRKPCPKGETRVQRLKRWRESQLWTEGFQGVGPAPEGTCWVDIADRGADIFEAMRTALDLGHQFLFRATQDRKIRRGPEPTDKAAYLKRLARSLPASVSSTVEVPGRGGRPARTARVQMAATQVWVQVPAIWKARHPEWGPIPVWVERVWEPEPPAGVEEPLEWILLSSLPVQTEAELLLRQAWYEPPPPDRGFPPSGEDRLR